MKTDAWTWLYAKDIFSKQYTGENMLTDQMLKIIIKNLRTFPTIPNGQLTHPVSSHLRNINYAFKDCLKRRSNF